MMLAAKESYKKIRIQREQILASCFQECELVLLLVKRSYDGDQKAFFRYT